MPLRVRLGASEPRLSVEPTRLCAFRASWSQGVTASQRLASEIIEAIDALSERIPRLEIPHRLTAPHARGARHAHARHRQGHGPICTNLSLQR